MRTADGWAKAQGIPLYDCHKQVRAAKIVSLPEFPDAGPQLELEGLSFCYPVTRDWMAKHEPKVGGYLVFYEDGYTSYSPAGAFEAGYTRTP